MSSGQVQLQSSLSPRRIAHRRCGWLWEPQHGLHPTDLDGVAREISQLRGDPDTGWTEPVEGHQYPRLVVLTAGGSKIGFTKQDVQKEQVGQLVDVFSCFVTPCFGFETFWPQKKIKLVQLQVKYSQPVGATS